MNMQPAVDSRVSEKALYTQVAFHNGQSMETMNTRKISVADSWKSIKNTKNIKTQESHGRFSDKTLATHTTFSQQNVGGNIDHGTNIAEQARKH